MACLDQLAAGGAAVLRRMTSSVGTMVVPFEMAGSATLRRSSRMLRRPTAAKSWRTVVSGGQNEAAVPMSSKPTTLTSPGCHGRAMREEQA